MKPKFEYQHNKQHISWKICIFANDSKLEKSFWYVFSIILRYFSRNIHNLVTFSYHLEIGTFNFFLFKTRKSNLVTSFLAVIGIVFQSVYIINRLINKYFIVIS